jgi:hypothetical protein
MPIEAKFTKSNTAMHIELVKREGGNFPSKVSLGQLNLDESINLRNTLNQSIAAWQNATKLQ